MPKNLLVVDDSVTIQKVVEIIFAHEDIRILRAVNGDDAVMRLREARPDAALVDQVLPGPSGYDVVARLRGDPSMAQTPIFLMACTSEPFDENKARQSGANGFIQKPFDSSTMLDRVLGSLGMQSTQGRAGQLQPAGSARPAAPPAAPPPPIAASLGIPAPPRAPASAIPATPMAPPGGPRGTGPISQPGALNAPFPAGAVPASIHSPFPPGAAPVGGAARPGVAPAAAPPAGWQPGPAPLAQQPQAARPAAPPPAASWGAPAGFPPAPAQQPRPVAPVAPPQAARPVAPVAPPGAPPKAPASKDPFGFSLDMDGGGQQRPAPAAGLDFGNEPAPVRQPAPMPHHAPAPLAPAAPPSAVSAAVQGAMQSLPPEVSAATRDMIEKVVWEVVPELAEIIIREELKRLLKERGMG